MTACSLVTEFPETLSDGGTTVIDSGVTGLTSCSTNRDCESDELCCAAGGGSTAKRCQPANGAKECSVCSETCDDTAPNCSKGVCECVPGSGEGCTGGQVCDPNSDPPKCVGCISDASCAGNTAGRTQCVNGECETCDRKNPSDPSDDEGCTDPNASVCSEDLTCIGCRGPSDCPEGLSCVGGRGCFGCEPDKDIGANRCKAEAPVCKQAAGGFQCERCTSNADCKDGFCNEPVGTCHNECDPASTTGSGCPTAAAPICRVTAGVAACDRCNVGDPCPTGQMCQTIGTTAGQCVPMMSACPAGQVPGPAGTCVACTTDVHCATNAAGPVCGASNTCGPCVPGTAGDAICARVTPAAPICGAAGTCVARCRGDAECATSPRTPICGGDGRCVACTEERNPDDACEDANEATPVCVRTGATAGTCAVCNQGSACSIRRGESGICLPAPAGGPLACNRCDPNAILTLCPIGQRCEFSMAESRFACLPVPAASNPLGGLLGVQREVR